MELIHAINYPKNNVENYEGEKKNKQNNNILPSGNVHCSFKLTLIYFKMMGRCNHLSLSHLSWE